MSSPNRSLRRRRLTGRRRIAPFRRVGGWRIARRCAALRHIFPAVTRNLICCHSAGLRDRRGGSGSLISCIRRLRRLLVVSLCR